MSYIGQLSADDYSETNQQKIERRLTGTVVNILRTRGIEISYDEERNILNNNLSHLTDLDKKLEPLTKDINLDEVAEVISRKNGWSYTSKGEKLIRINNVECLIQSIKEIALQITY